MSYFITTDNSNIYFFNSVQLAKPDILDKKGDKFIIYKRAKNSKIEIKTRIIA